MSETDSFIEEVSEELRRDRLYSMMRKYGWIAVVLVLLLVGAAAYNEWRKASDRAQAQALGDAILSADQHKDDTARVAALEAIDAQGDAAAVVTLLALHGDGAAQGLRAVINQPDADVLYRDLARLKLVSLPDAGLTMDERRAMLAPLSVAGAPFRVLAEEQLALMDVETGDKDAAIARLRAILVDDEASGPLRRRASQLIVALGGVIDPS